MNKNIHTTLGVHAFREEVPLSRVFELTPRAISADWFGQATMARFSFALALSPGKLLFGATVNKAPDCDRTKQSGEFVEGLWERELAEFFIAAPHGSAYQEFNLAPTGAWWSCGFTEYRVRSGQPVCREGVRCLSEISPNGWRAAIEVPTATFLHGLPTAGLRANVTGILGAPEARQFLSFAKIPGEPDFHQVRHFPVLMAAE